MRSYSVLRILNSAFDSLVSQALNRIRHRRPNRLRTHGQQRNHQRHHVCHRSAKPFADADFFGARLGRK